MILVLLCLVQDVDVDVRLRAARAAYDGRIAARGTSGSGTILDAAELGLDDAELVPGLEASVTVPSMGRFRAEYMRFATEGDGVLAAGAVFDDVPYPPGTAVESALEFWIFSLDYEYPLLPATGRPWFLSLEADFRYIAGHASLDDGSGDVDARLNRPVLMPGLRSGVGLAPGLDAELSLAGVAFSAQSVVLRWLEIDVELTVRPWSGLVAALGWRFERLDLEARKDSTNADLDGVLSGPFVALGWRF
jgi:hypothetical protein